MLVYADTSVFGGVFDPEFEQASSAFFERVRNSVLEVAVSALVLDELARAPEHVNRFFAGLEPFIVRVDIDEAAYALRRDYLEANVVSFKWAADALHVAVATVSGCQAIVSWNFQHIVNSRRIPLYNEVNRMAGYSPISIHTPPEVVPDEED
ncbi:MAG TPA: PIN domain-containing protein [Candidatus Hydrogenedentes bacterium]|nr:PIN domain-containing protein [Candidatus Hydrogenedentota bacterium]